MGYQGLIITDALEMKAIHDNYSPREIVSKFFNATGGDLLLVGGDCDANFEPLYKELISLYSNGEIDKQLLENSFNRITSLQNQFVEPNYEARF